MLRRAKLLQHRLVYFTENDPFYLDKARSHPGTPLVIGADALLRMLDPQWGHDPVELFQEFMKLGMKFYLVGREVDGTFLKPVEAMQAVCEKAKLTPMQLGKMFRVVEGRWDVSSTALRHHQDPPDGTTSAESAPTRSAAPPTP